MFYILLSVICLFLINCDAQVDPRAPNLHSGLTEKIGNFSIELLYHTSQAQPNGTNLIISPITVWTTLAIIAEGATDDTLREISKTIRTVPKNKYITRRDFQTIMQWLVVKKSTVELQKFNALFIDETKSPLIDFIDSAKAYDARLISANFSNSGEVASQINHVISNFTRGKITKLLQSDDLKNTKFVLTSALYFKGQWARPFNASFTTLEPFYDSHGNVLGQVNMMYNRHTYPFANIKALQARVLELPYGEDNRLSMLVMLPNPGVSVNEMFHKFDNVSLDIIFTELKYSAEQFGDDEVDCYIPRFKIESSLDLTDSLKTMGIYDLFDVSRARLPFVSKVPVYVSKVIQKAQIEVTEEGTVASAVTAAEFGNRIGAIKFYANRPFCYLIIEKVTNSIAFGGFYQTPTVY